MRPSPFQSQPLENNITLAPAESHETYRLDNLNDWDGTRLRGLNPKIETILNFSYARNFR